MRFLGEDATPSILFVNGGSAVKPGRNVTGTSVAFAGQAAYAELLHEVLGEEGIYVGQLIIGGRIIEGDDEKDPDVLADRLWELHTKRDTFRDPDQRRLRVGALPARRNAAISRCDGWCLRRRLGQVSTTDPRLRGGHHAQLAAVDRHPRRHVRQAVPRG